MIDKLIQSTFLMAVLFGAAAMTTASVMRWTDHMTSPQWLSALNTCAWLCAAVVGKRALGDVGRAISKRNGGGREGVEGS